MPSASSGRGPSVAMGILSGLFGLAFAVFWTVMAARTGAPTFFVLFGVGFIVLILFGTIKHVSNLARKPPMSDLGIPPQVRKPDPIARAFGHDLPSLPPPEACRAPNEPVRRYQGDQCPFCGAKVEEHFDFCPACGKNI